MNANLPKHGFMLADNIFRFARMSTGSAATTPRSMFIFQIIETFHISKESFEDTLFTDKKRVILEPLLFVDLIRVHLV